MMAFGRVCGVKVAGISAAVPAYKRALIDELPAFTQDEIRKLSENTGIQSRHIAPEGMCTSDLCHCAAERLLDELGWQRDTVDALIFVSQTPDYILPATSCTLQHRLGLSKHCAAFDINQGCSGYIYGLFVVSQLLLGGVVKRALLLVGDTLNRIVSPQDRSTALLFGDAGTATALEMSPHAAPVFFGNRSPRLNYDYLLACVRKRYELFHRAWKTHSPSEIEPFHLRTLRLSGR